MANGIIAPIRFIRLNPVKTVLAVFSYILPFILALYTLAIGSIPFWYDVARDFLLAWDNHTKIRLIGPTTGIPGLFYGPYWIWAESIMLLITRDPRIVTGTLFFIPFFVGIPYLLSRFRTVFPVSVLISMWVLFIASSWQNAIHPWNPHVVYPLFLLLTATLILRDPKERVQKTILRLTSGGFISGIMLNSHISYSLGITIASVIYIAWTAYAESPKKHALAARFGRMALACGIYLGALLVMFLPFFLFESRHDFLQLKTLGTTLGEAVFRNASVVTVTGMKKAEIVRQFLVVVPEQIIHINNSLITYITYAALAVVLVWKRPAALNPTQRNTLRYVLLCLLTLASIYLASSNPVWGYHFIGTEWLIIMLLGLLAAIHKITRNATLLWAIMLLVQFVPKLITTITADHRILSTLGTKQTTVRDVFLHSGDTPFGYAVYSTSLYSYDYDYLFRWLGEDIYRRPTVSIDAADTVYILIPETDPAIAEDFVHAKTPDAIFTTTNTWKTPDKVTVIVRERKK